MVQAPPWRSRKNDNPLGGVPNKTQVGRPDIDAFFRRLGASIIALTVKDILEEQIARKLA